jgi:uncharacterized protein YybS (DUF2232 family)
MDKLNNFFQKLFHLMVLLLVLLYLYPGSILGFLIYGDFRLQPQILENFMYFSFNHFFIFFLIACLGFFSHLYTSKFKFITLYLFFLSFILEILHILIPERSFQFSDLAGNVLGVLSIYCIVFIYNLRK